jgi:hypothetical protein
MPPSGYIPGAGVRAPMLERFAKPSLKPPENFVGNLVFPDAQVTSFLNLAPISGNEELEVADDDMAGLKTDFNEVMFSEAEYEFEIGFRGRKAIIGVIQKMKAEQAAALARGLGSSSNEMFNLESRVTNLITAQHVRRNELLKIGQLTKTANYPTANVLDPIEIDTITAAAFVELLSTAGALVEAAGHGPATDIIFGAGAWNGALRNASMLDLLPDTAYKILTADAFLPVLKLPANASPRVSIATATYKTKKKATPTPMMNLYIWVGRTNPNPSGSGDGFGYNFWHPHPDSGGPIFVYRMVVGSQRNIHISVEGFDRPLVNDGSQGVLIPVTLSA